MLGSHPQNMDSESLQTDVMRFMAIIAFCLIAILALVRESAPTSGDQTSGAAASAETPPTSAPPREDVAPMASQGASQVASQEVEPAAAVAEPEPMKALEPLPRLPDEDPLDQEGDTTGSSAASADPSGQPDSSPTGAADLSLRFASDRDFMRLVTRGDIQVYAFRDRDVLSLDRSFHFLETPAPTRVYALEPKTIPALVTVALSARRDDADTFDWGIRMPERLETRIRDFLDQGATGALVIDRYGEVLHVAGG